MPSQREDYLLRLLRQIAETLRRLREKLSSEAAPAEVVREAEEAIAQLLGPRYQLLSSLDAASATALLADARRIELWADLLSVEAAGRRALGDSGGAGILDKRADDLRRSGLSAGGGSAR